MFFFFFFWIEDCGIEFGTLKIWLIIVEISCEYEDWIKEFEYVVMEKKHTKEDEDGKLIN